jgi:hypothetical protein
MGNLSWFLTYILILNTSITYYLLPITYWEIVKDMGGFVGALSPKFLPPTNKEKKTAPPKD